MGKLRTKIMQEDHDVPMDCGGKTIRVAIGKKIYWPKMKWDVKHFVCISIKC
jgi:hypothetical protein